MSIGITWLIGRLYVHDFMDFNLCLLASWIKRYNLSKHKTWREIFYHKYDTSNTNILTTTRNASPFWKWVAWEVCEANVGYRWNVANG
jgi:hypothetical protein